MPNKSLILLHGKKRSKCVPCACALEAPYWIACRTCATSRGCNLSGNSSSNTSRSMLMRLCGVCISGGAACFSAASTALKLASMSTSVFLRLRSAAGAMLLLLGCLAQGRPAVGPEHAVAGGGICPPAAGVVSTGLAKARVVPSPAGADATPRVVATSAWLGAGSGPGEGSGHGATPGPGGGSAAATPDGVALGLWQPRSFCIVVVFCGNTTSLSVPCCSAPCDTPCWSACCVREKPLIRHAVHARFAARGACVGRSPAAHAAGRTHLRNGTSWALRYCRALGTHTRHACAARDSGRQEAHLGQKHRAARRAGRIHRDGDVLRLSRPPRAWRPGLATAAPLLRLARTDSPGGTF